MHKTKRRTGEPKSHTKGFLYPSIECVKSLENHLDMSNIVDIFPFYQIRANQQLSTSQKDSVKLNKKTSSVGGKNLVKIVVVILQKNTAVAWRATDTQNDDKIEMIVERLYPHYRTLK